MSFQNSNESKINELLRCSKANQNNLETKLSHENAESLNSILDKAGNPLTLLFQK